MFQALDLHPTRVVSTAFTTFTYLLTTFVSGRTVTKTDIVVSTQVVTDRIEPTPVLKPVEVRKFELAFYIVRTFSHKKVGENLGLANKILHSGVASLRMVKVIPVAVAASTLTLTVVIIPQVF